MFKALYEVGDHKYEDVAVYRKLIDPTIEQKWVDKYLQPVIDELGSDDFLDSLNISHSTQPTTMNRNICEMYYRGTPDGGHWYSHRVDDKEWFDSYTSGYQILGTNQFCQTFALMHIYNELPPKVSGKFKYYTYTKAALNFMARFPKIAKMKEYKELVRHPHLCFNCIEQ